MMDNRTGQVLKEIGCIRTLREQLADDLCEGGPLSEYGLSPEDALRTVDYLQGRNWTFQRHELPGDMAEIASMMIFEGVNDV